MPEKYKHTFKIKQFGIEFFLPSKMNQLIVAEKTLQHPSINTEEIAVKNFSLSVA